MNTKKKGFNLFYLFLILLVFVFIMFAMVDINTNIEQIEPSTAITWIKEGKVEEIYAYNGEARVLLRDSKVEDKTQFPNQADAYFKYTSQSWEQILTEIQTYNDGKTEELQIKWSNPPVEASWFETLMPFLYIGLGLLSIYLIFRMFTKSNSNAMQFGKNKARLTSNIKVRFSDIAGAEEEKAELQEIVEFLKNPQKFTELGARIPKGVLLVGNPGTGKTLLARAVAGESNVPFLSISGSDCVEMFVGVGASRVRDLFDQAKKAQPCIVFIDEIDAVGRQRGAGLGGGNDEREQTLNQLLVEMDGFEANEGIIVLAATNRSDVLDPALLRPGRFDRQIYVNVPDVKGREGIIRIHAKNKPIADDVDFQTLARITSGFTGADLENMLNEAAILAARNHRPKILMQDITEGINKVLMGPQKKSLLVTEKDKLITAYHESGHAIVGKLLEHCEEVQEVSIIPRGAAAGYTMSRPDNDDNHMGKLKLNDTISMMMGGRLSEELFMEDISTGASNDIKRATELARKMVTVWGMSDKFGFMSFNSEEEIFVGRNYQSKNEYSETTAFEIDKEVKKILDYNYNRAKKILTENSELVKQMAQLLLEKDTIYKDEVDMLMAGVSKEEIIKHMDEQSEKRRKEEEKARKTNEKEKKIKEIEMRVKTAELYLKEGIISQKDYDLILKEKEKAIQKLNEDEQENLEQTNDREKTTDKVEINESKEDTKDQTEIIAEQKKEENKEETTTKQKTKKTSIAKDKKEKKDDKKE